ASRATVTRPVVRDQPDTVVSGARGVLVIQQPRVRHPVVNEDRAALRGPSLQDLQGAPIRRDQIVLDDLLILAIPRRCVNPPRARALVVGLAAPREMGVARLVTTWPGLQAVL